MPPAEGAARQTAWPTLLPLDAIGGSPVLEDPDKVRDALLARAGNLRARAAILRAPASNDAEMERLRQRLVR